jgi:hypothetical protein
VEPSDELRRCLLDLYVAMSSGDASRVEAIYSTAAGVSFIGSDANEFWKDPEQHNADVRRFFDGSLGRNTWSSGEAPLAMEEGTVGWTVDRPTVVLGDGTIYSGLRVTLVWHREGAEWKVVQSHASVGQQ